MTADRCRRPQPGDHCPQAAAESDRCAIGAPEHTWSTRHTARGTSYYYNEIINGGISASFMQNNTTIQRESVDVCITRILISRAGVARTKFILGLPSSQSAEELVLDCICLWGKRERKTISYFHGKSCNYQGLKGH